MNTRDEINAREYAESQERLALDRGEPLPPLPEPEPVTLDDVMQACENYAVAYAVALNQPRGSAYWQRADRLHKTLAETVLAFGNECRFTGEVL